MKFSPFPELISNRLILRSIKESDCDTILFLRSDMEVNKFIQRPEHRQTNTKSDALKFIKQLSENSQNGISISWGITLKNEPQIIGTICLWNFSKDHKTGEVGYDLKPEFQNKGIMNEALNLIIDFGFNKLKLYKIEAFTDHKNESSKKLLEKNRFQFIENRKDYENTSNIIFELVNVSI